MNMPKSDLADTEELPLLGAKPARRSGRIHVDYAALSDRGLVRTNNEDHYLVARFGRFLAPCLTNITGQDELLFEEDGHGMVVADGMGGAAAGEVASAMAIRTLINLVIDTPDWIMSPDGSLVERVLKRMAERYRQIDDALVEESKQNARRRGMGTTMTLACHVGDSLIVIHVGDSRAYLFRHGKLHQLTHDHTLAQSLVDQGILERVDDAAAPMQHTLTRVLGGGGGECEADVQRVTLLDQDTIVLCTDGLSDMVSDDAIARVLAANMSAADACHTLVGAALKNGGKDNVTVIVARFGFFARPATRAAEWCGL